MWDGRSSISGHVAGRFGVGIGDQESAGDALIPPEVTLEDGVSEDEAVQTALWNNAVFQETLTQLGISHAQLLDAGLIADPQFQVFFPLGPKQLEFTTHQAIDALWLRPVRVRAAELDVDRVTHSMVQNGLDLIRDARVAHANLAAANEQAEVAREAASLRQQIADLAQKRLDAGIVAIPDGASIVVTAPLTGTLLTADGASAIVAGQSVPSGSTVFQLRPLLSPEREVPTAAERVAMANAKATLVSARIVADGDAKQAQAQVEAAEIALVRARRLLADRAGSQRDVDDAVARVEVAKKGLEAAQARKQLLDKLSLDADTGQLTTIPVAAPRGGILRTVSSSVGQTVSAGAPLFEVVSLDRLWVRVPVYPGLREEIARDSNALIRDLGADDGEVAVKPVAAPPSADPLAATVDLFYEVANTDGRFHPGERVEVTLPVAGETESLVIPRAAVLRDIHGIAWVYVNTAEQTFERRRVEVHFSTEKLSVLSRGPEVGTPVVVDGAAELFGTEFGADK